MFRQCHSRYYSALTSAPKVYKITARILQLIRTRLVWLSADPCDTSRPDGMRCKVPNPLTMTHCGSGIGDQRQPARWLIVSPQNTGTDVQSRQDVICFPGTQSICFVTVTLRTRHGGVNIFTRTSAQRHCRTASKTQRRRRMEKN